MPNPFNVAVPNVAQSLLGFQRARKLRQDDKTSQQSREIALERLGLLKNQDARAASNADFARTDADRNFELREKAFNAKPSPLSFDQKLQLKKAGASRTNVQVSGDKKGGEELSKLTSKAFVKAQEGAALAQSRSSENEVLRQSLSNPDLFTGAGGDTIQTFKKIGEAAGFDIRGVADGDIVQTIGRKAALKLKGDLPGPMSDSDRKFLVGLPPGLTKSPEANRRLLLISDLNDQRKIDTARIYRENLQENGSVSPRVFAEISNSDAKFVRQMSGHIKELRAQNRQLKPRGPLAGVSIGQMNAKQLNSLNPKDLTRNQMIEAIARERQLDGQ